jgi:hypothetical protein
MGFVRNIVRDAGIERESRIGDGLSVTGTRNTVNGAAGNQAVTVAAMLGGLASFSGAAGAVAYTYPTGAQIQAAFPNMAPGDTYLFAVVNTAVQVATFTGASGSTATGLVTANADSRNVLMECTGNAPGAGTFTLFHF